MCSAPGGRRDDRAIAVFRHGARVAPALRRPRPDSTRAAPWPRWLDPRRRHRRPRRAARAPRVSRVHRRCRRRGNEMTAAAALAIMIDVSGSTSPRVDRLARALAPVIASCAVASGRHARELAEIAWVESSYRRHVVGALGERGPWQILPRTGRRQCHDLRWRSDATANCLCAARVLSWAESTPCRVRTAYRGACRRGGARR